MKGGRIALPIEYVSKNNSGNYHPVVNHSSRSQIGCTDMLGPDLQVQNGGYGKKKNSVRRGSKKSKKSKKNGANNGMA